MGTWKDIVTLSLKAQDFGAYIDSLVTDHPLPNLPNAGESVATHFNPHFVVLHNTAAPRMDQWHSVPGEQRIQNLVHYYRDTQKWSGGPHLFIADDLIWAFTPLWTSGVHSPSWNHTSWGVEMVGDYETEILLDGTRANLIAALAGIHRYGGLDPATLKLHKEDPLTTHDCPGKNILKTDVIQWVREAMQPNV